MMSNNSNTIEIHEFSTGINFERLANDNWVSIGFTGVYMNNTLTEIPETVKRAIANKLFDIVEGTASDKPAIIARVVNGNQEYPDYSVLALVTCGRDDSSRPFAAYRYFLCEGKDSLWKLIVYIEHVKRAKKQLPVFNPLDNRQPEHPIKYTINSVPQQKRPPQELDNSATTILIPPDISLDLETFNSYASFLAGNQPSSWAYGVKDLERLWDFVLIYPDSDKDYQYLKEKIANPPVQAKIANFDEQAIKSAIKSLMNNSQVKVEAVKNIAVGLENKEISLEYWQKLFNAEGADKALKDNFTSEPITRLLTLQAIVIPETIIKFAEWLEGQKNDNLVKASQEFQREFKKNFLSNCSQAQINSFSKKIGDGIKLILKYFLEKGKNTTTTPLRNFLNQPSNIWLISIPEIVKGDLGLISQNYRTFKNKKLYLDQDFWKPISNYSPRNPVSFYKPLSELFNALKHYDLAAYFYQISTGIVPKPIFEKTGFKNYKKTHKLYDITLIRQMDIMEKMVLFVSTNQKNIILSLISLLAITGIGAIGYKIGNDQGFQAGKQQGFAEGKTEGLQEAENKAKAVTQNQLTADQKQKKIIETALDKFPETQKAIKQIIGDDKKKLDSLIKIIDPTNTINPDIIIGNSDNKSEKEKWVSAILNYQKKVFSSGNADGIISADGETSKKLKNALTPPKQKSSTP